MRPPLVVGTLWFACGLIAGLLRPIPGGGGSLVIAALAAAGMAGAGALRAGGAAEGRMQRPWVAGLLAVAGLLTGMATRTGVDRSCLAWLPEQAPVRVIGVITGGGGRVGLRIDSLGVGPGMIACGAEVPARWSDGAGPTAGTRVVGTGRWWSPPGSRGLLRRPGVLLMDAVAARGPVGAEESRGEGEVRREGLAVRIRQAGVARIEEVFPRHAPLVSSLLLAQRGGLDREVRERYARAGLSHLLAISGLHVGLVAGILVLLTGAARIPRHHAAWVAGAGTIGYVALLGAPASAARAALQIVLVLAARWLQRPTRTEAVIAAAALVLLAMEPASIASPGFQLSFAGVVGILALRRPILARLDPVNRVRLAGRPVGRWLADGLATSLAATVATGPIVAWHFGRVAPVGVVANLVAIPLLSAAVPALGLALFAGVVWVPAGRFLAGGAELLLDALDRTATVAASAPYGTVAVLPVSAVALTAAVALGFGLSRRLGRVRPWIRQGTWAGIAGAVLLVAPLRAGGDRLELHMIDVGQGDAIAIRSPAGRWLLVDAGLAGADYDAGERRVVPYLAARGVRRLEGLVITHADADHMGGAGAVVREIGTRWAGGPGVVAGKGQYLDLLRETRAAGVPWLGVRQGMEFELDGMVVTILFPSAADTGVEDANDASVVMRVAYGEFAVLLTGDAPSGVERGLVARLGPSLDADVLKVGHHGSRTSTTEELLEATGARTALISAGRGNRYGHPHRVVVARLRQADVDVYRTDRHGTVVVRGRADGRMTVVTER